MALSYLRTVSTILYKSNEASSWMMAGIRTRSPSTERKLNVTKRRACKSAELRKRKVRRWFSEALLLLSKITTHFPGKPHLFDDDGPV